MSVFFSIPFLLLSYLFLSAARQKFNNRSYTELTISNYQIIPSGLNSMVTLMLIIAEFCTAILLVIPSLEMLAMSASLLLLSVYSTAIAVNLVRGRLTLDCGCHGLNHRQNISYALLLRNLVLISVITLLIWLQVSLPNTTGAWLIALSSSCFLTLAHSSFSQLKANQQQINKHSSIS